MGYSEAKKALGRSSWAVLIFLALAGFAITGCSLFGDDGPKKRTFEVRYQVSVEQVDEYDHYVATCAGDYWTNLGDSKGELKYLGILPTVSEGDPFISELTLTVSEGSPEPVGFWLTCWRGMLTGMEAQLSVNGETYTYSTYGQSPTLEIWGMLTFDGFEEKEPDEMPYRTRTHPRTS
jgi:hypothetical protein